MRIKQNTGLFLFLMILLVTCVYGIIYSRMNYSDFGFKSNIDPFYFSFATMTSTGYGDLYPRTTLSKLLVMSQMTLVLASVWTFVQNV